MPNVAGIPIIPLIVLIVIFLLVFRFFWRLSKANAASEAILATGLPATATVLELQDTGTRVNSYRIVKMSLAIDSADFGSYQSSLRAMIPMINLAQVQPGQVVNVKIDPTNQQNVALDLR